MKRQLLIVDDEEILLTAMASFFRARDFDVETATEAEEAIAMVKHHRFALVITDLELNSIEGLDGFAVLKAIRRSSPSTKIIVYSGYFDSPTVEAALGYGGRFVAKPASFARLLEVAEELCSPS
jgi:DNA-binding NtrC family response regulator